MNFFQICGLLVLVYSIITIVGVRRAARGELDESRASSFGVWTAASTKSAEAFQLANRAAEPYMLRAGLFGAAAGAVALLFPNALLGQATFFIGFLLATAFSVVGISVGNGVAKGQESG